MDIQKIYSNAEVVRVEKELEGLFLAHKPSWANFDDEERGRKYPELHPVQGKLEKEMWEILTAEQEEYNAWYDLGVAGMPCKYSEEYAVGENELLYLRDRPHNWNEGFDPELTKDMFLIYAVHCLYDHTNFAMLDFLWAREFTSEIKVVIDGRFREEEPMESFYYSGDDPYEPE